MRYVRVIGWSVVALACALCLLIATADDAKIAASIRTTPPHSCRSLLAACTP